MFRAAVLIVALVVSPLLGVAAQDATVVAPGTRVRVTTGDEIFEGTILAQQGDSLRLEVPDDTAPVSVARLAITEIAVSGGQHSYAGTGAKYGFLAGAAGGVGLLVWVSYCDGFLCGHVDSGAFAASAMVFGAAGALVGALVGSQFTSERWEQLPLSHLHVTIGHGEPGLALSFSL
jgi:hypothetical protein